MTQCVTGWFTDTEEYQTSLLGLTTEFVLTQSGTFDARLSRAQLPNLSLLQAHERLARVAYISLPPASTVFSIVTSPGLPLFWNGIEIEPGAILYHSRGERLHQRITGPAHWGFVAFSSAFFAHYAGALAGRELIPPSFGRIVRPAHDDVLRLRRLHARIVHAVETRPLTISHPEVARALEHELLHLLVSCLGVSEGYDAPGEQVPGLQVMARLEEVLAAQPREAISVRRLCAIIGVTERSLRLYCHTFLGVSLSNYMVLRRLNLVRVAMLRADPLTTRVADFVRPFGFADSGHFITAYQHAFGETPLETLARLRDGRKFSQSA